jgi:sulfatase modifying factor 1
MRPATLRSLGFVLFVIIFSHWKVLAADEKPQPRPESVSRVALGQEQKARTEPTAEIALGRPKPVPAGAPALTPAPPSAGGLPIPEMVFVPPGEFIMGSINGTPDETPVRQVYLDGYYIGKYEVTNKEFAAFVKDRNYVTWAERTRKGCVPERGKWKNVPGADWRHPRGPATFLDGLDNHPVVQVSWNDANEYCAWLSQKTGYRYRLPTEAEWEKASRGADARTWPWGNTYPEIWANVAGDYDGHEFTAPVGSFQQNVSPYGCYDMAGNVWEWCSDWYSGSYYQKAPARSPQGPTSGIGRVIRGGSFYYFASYLGARCSNRGIFPPDAADCNLGFRVVYELP